MVKDFKPTQCRGTAVPFLEFTVWDDTNFWKGLSYFYSMTPWLGGLTALIVGSYLFIRAGIIVHRRAPERPYMKMLEFWLSDCMECWVFGIFCFIVVPTIVFIAKSIIDKPRPDGTCLESPGMPSGHSATSVSVIVYAAFWLFLGRGSKILSTYALILWMVGVLFFYGPVAWARTELHDHSFAQVMAGTGFGIGLTLIWMLVLPFSYKGWYDWQSGRKSKIETYAAENKNDESETESLASTPKKIYESCKSIENIPGNIEIDPTRIQISSAETSAT